VCVCEYVYICMNECMHAHLHACTQVGACDVCAFYYSATPGLFMKQFKFLNAILCVSMASTSKVFSYDKVSDSLNGADECLVSDTSCDNRKSHTAKQGRKEGTKNAFLRRLLDP
jgi:hypothetical protein